MAALKRVDSMALHPAEVSPFKPCLPQTSLPKSPATKNPPANLFVDSETPNSLQVHWSPPDAAVQHYRLTYTPETGQKHQEMITLSGKSRSVTLHSLHPGTIYTVTVSAVYATGESDPVSTTGQTASTLARLPTSRGSVPFKTDDCPALSSADGSLQGFDLMEAFGLQEKEYASIKGVAMEPYIFLGTHTYTLYRDIQLTRQTREVFASGIPSEYTIAFLLRLLPESPRESFAVWQVTDEDFQPLLGIVLDPNKKSLTYFNRDYDADVEEVTFDQLDVKKVFYGSFHKVLIGNKEMFIGTVTSIFSLSYDSKNIPKTFADFFWVCACADILMDGEGGQERIIVKY